MNEDFQEMVEEFDELFQKGMKITQKWKQKMGMRSGYNGYNQRMGRMDGSDQRMGRMNGFNPMRQDDGWFDPRFM